MRGETGKSIELKPPVKEVWKPDKANPGRPVMGAPAEIKGMTDEAVPRETTTWATAPATAGCQQETNRSNAVATRSTFRLYLGVTRGPLGTKAPRPDRHVA